MLHISFAVLISTPVQSELESANLANSAPAGGR